MRALEFDDPVYCKEEMAKPRGGPVPPSPSEVDDLVSILRKKNHYQKVDLYGEPAYGRSLEVELFIVEDWRRWSRFAKGAAIGGSYALALALIWFGISYSSVLNAG